MRIVPQDHHFTAMFGEMADNLGAASALLHTTLSGSAAFEPHVQRLKEIEHQGDELTHSIMTRLNTTFITPFDREDIHRLAAALDDVLDFIYAAGERLVMYHIAAVPQPAAELAAVLVRQVAEIKKAIPSLAAHDHVLEKCVEINRLENEADRIVRAAIAALFERERDPIQLIKLKELYEVLETAIDKAEDVANVLESIVVKSA